MSKAATKSVSFTKPSNRPRFQRVSPIKFILQQREVDIIRQVYKHRFLSSRHIVALIPGNKERLLYRLKCLFHSGYLDRPQQQIKPFTREGSQPLVYGLGNKGADLLARYYNIPRLRTDWTTKNREIKQPQIEHTLMVADFMVCLELACDKFKYTELIEPEQILAMLPNQSRKRVKVFHWQFDIEKQSGDQIRNFRFTLRPDKIFGIYFPEDLPGRDKVYYFLEADRGTMPIKRSSPYITSYFGKMQAYHEAWHRNEYQRIFGTRAVRILTLAKSEERIQNMIKAGKRVNKSQNGSKIFWFARASEFTLNSPLHIFDEVWQNGRDGELMSIVL